MDIEALMAQQGMRDFTDEQRNTLVNDAVQIRQLAQIIQARLANTEIEGDKTGAASRRARKVTRQFEKVAKLLEKAAAGCEGINATYVHEVIELPGRRKKALVKKAERRQQRALAKGAAGALIAKSLTKSTTGLNASQASVNAQASTPAAAIAPAPQYVNPQPWAFQGQAGGQAQPLPPISSFFPDQEAM